MANPGRKDINTRYENRDYWAEKLKDAVKKDAPKAELVKMIKKL